MPIHIKAEKEQLSPLVSDRSSNYAIQKNRRGLFS